MFFTDKKPGITASLAVRDRDGHPTAIIGVDIFLDDLSRFLASLRISDRSESMIVDEKARGKCLMPISWTLGSSPRVTIFNVAFGC